MACEALTPQTPRFQDFRPHVLRFQIGVLAACRIDRDLDVCCPVQCRGISRELASRERCIKGSYSLVEISTMIAGSLASLQDSA